MKLSIILLSILVCYVSSKRLMHLTDSNMWDSINKYTTKGEAVLLKVYAPWCPHCHDLDPHLKKNVDRVKKWDIPVTMAEIDGDTYPEPVEQFNIDGFPQLILFYDGQHFMYNGSTDFPQLIWGWMRKKIVSKDLCQVQGIAEVDELNSAPDMGAVVTYTGPKYGSDYSNFRKVASNLESTDAVFYESSDPKVIDYLGEHRITIFRNFDGGFVQMGSNYSRNKLQKFVNTQRVKLVYDVENKDSKMLMKESNKVVLILVKSDYGVLDNDTYTFGMAAHQYPTNFEYMFAAQDSASSRRFAKKYNVSGPFPKVFAIVGGEEGSVEMKASFTTSHILRFMREIMNN